MSIDFHLLRPWWLSAYIPLLGIFWLVWRQNSPLNSWAAICDSHLLKHLVVTKETHKRHWALLFLFASAIFMILSLTGPCWLRFPVPSYHVTEPHVIVLSLSADMLAKDVAPDRLSRAKFILHDLFTQAQTGQFALIVFTAEPFIVSPLTEDARTIDALLSSLTPSIMPVVGYRLDTALVEAKNLIKQAGFKQGKILLMTANLPDVKAIKMAKKLASQGIYTSLMPLKAAPLFSPFFKLVAAGKGKLLSFNGTKQELSQ